MISRISYKIWILISLIILVTGGFLTYRYWWLPKGRRMAEEIVKPSLVKNGSLVRQRKDNRIYHIIKNQKHWMPSKEILNLYGFDQNKIIEVDSIDAFPKARLLRAVGSQEVYYIYDDGTKKEHLTPKVSLSYNCEWEDIIEVSDKELETYPEVNLIKIADSSQIFLAEGDTKRLIPPKVFDLLGFNPNKVRTVTITDFNSYVTIPPLETVQE